MPSRWMLRESAHIESVPAHLSVSCYCLTLAPAPTRRRGQHYGEVPGPPDAPSKMVKRRSVKTVVVPTTVEKVVPIVREVPNKTTRKTKLTGTRMVPRHGHKTITEHEVQVKEEVVHGYRTVWRQVKEDVQREMLQLRHTCRCLAVRVPLSLHLQGAWPIKHLDHHLRYCYHDRNLLCIPSTVPPSVDCIPSR